MHSAQCTEMNIAALGSRASQYGHVPLPVGHCASLRVAHGSPTRAARPHNSVQQTHHPHTHTKQLQPVIAALLLSTVATCWSCSHTHAVRPMPACILLLKLSHPPPPIPSASPEHAAVG